MRDVSVALDLDGTLIDARHRQVGVAVEAVAALSGGQLDASRFWRHKRSGATTAGALIRLGYEEAIAAALAQRWRSRVEADDWLAQDRPLPGVVRRLTRLRDAGCAVLVITARSRPEGAGRSLRAAGLESHVDRLIVVDPSSAATDKADSLRGNRARWFVGDTESDGAAAAAADVPFVAVGTGQRSERYLRSLGYDVAASFTGAVDALAHHCAVSVTDRSE